MFPGPQRRMESDDEHTVAAMAVLQHRLEGASHGSAVSRVSVSHALSTVEVDQSMKTYPQGRMPSLAILARSATG